MIQIVFDNPRLGDTDVAFNILLIVSLDVAHGLASDLADKNADEVASDLRLLRRLWTR